MSTYIYFIIGAFLNSFAAYLIKISFSNIDSLSDIVTKGLAKESLFIILALISFFSAFIFYGLVLSKTNLNIAQPIFTALSMFFVILISLLFLNEPFSLKYFVGLFLIIVGIFIVSQPQVFFEKFCFKSPYFIIRNPVFGFDFVEISRKLSQLLHKYL